MKMVLNSEKITKKQSQIFVLKNILTNAKKNEYLRRKRIVAIELNKLK
jgi:hypothetical protein